jgi:diphthamide biosynthesis protein 3
MVLYDEVDLEDMSFDSEANMFFYPCPCGDKFQVSVDKLMDDSVDMYIAACPNCGLEVSVRFESVSNSFCN